MKMPKQEEMGINGFVKFNRIEFEIEIDKNNQLAKEFIKRLPISSEANNIGGEIYFRVPGVDLEYDGTQQEEFEIGDIVYWRSPIGEDKFAIAMLYGNTQYSNWKTPRTSSPCVKIGRLMADTQQMESLQSGENVKIFLEKINHQ